MRFTEQQILFPIIFYFRLLARNYKRWLTVVEAVAADGTEAGMGEAEVAVAVPSNVEAISAEVMDKEEETTRSLMTINLNFMLENNFN